MTRTTITADAPMIATLQGTRVPGTLQGGRAPAALQGGRAPAALLAALLVAGCGASPPPARTYPMDRIYGEECPSVVVAPDEYVVLTVTGSHHQESHLLVATCDETKVPDCTWVFCGRVPEERRAPRTVCLPGKVFRKLYQRPAGPGGPTPGTAILAEPFCVKGKCELGFSLWVVAHDESIVRRASCRLSVGELRFEDRPRGPDGREGDFQSLKLKCEVRPKVGDDPPRECYPPY